MLQTGSGYGDMKDAEGNEVGEVRGGGRRGCRWKWWIVLFAVLLVGAMPGVFCFRQQRLDEQLRALAGGHGGTYYEGARGPGWYVKLARKYKLPRLRQPLGFYSRTMTDEDMAVLGRANTLRVVGLTGSEISDAGMAHLKGLTKLQSLHLDNTKIGGAGLAHLSELTELRILHLDGTKVSDAGLVHLKKLKNLEQLGLNGTEVTDAGLAYLKSLKGLRYLGLAGTGVTSEGIADLKSAIPNVKVDFK